MKSESLPPNYSKPSDQYIFGVTTNTKFSGEHSVVFKHINGGLKPGEMSTFVPISSKPKKEDINGV